MERHAFFASPFELVTPHGTRDGTDRRFHCLAGWRSLQHTSALRESVKQRPRESIKERTERERALKETETERQKSQKDKEGMTDENTLFNPSFAPRLMLFFIFYSTDCKKKNKTQDKM